MKTFFDVPKEENKNTSCARCGRRLKNPESVAIGIGPVCLEKMGLSRKKPPPKMKRLKGGIYDQLKLFKDEKGEEEENAEKGGN